MHKFENTECKVNTRYVKGVFCNISPFLSIRFVEFTVITCLLSVHTIGSLNYNLPKIVTEHAYVKCLLYTDYNEVK